MSQHKSANSGAEVRSMEGPSNTRMLSSSVTLRVIASVLAVGVVGAVVLKMKPDAYTLHLMVMSMIWGVFAVGWNLASGYGGLKTFGHQGFFGIAAYASALLSMHFALSPWLTIWIGALIAAAVSVVVVAPVLRLRSTPQIAIVTLAFGEIARIIIENVKSVTRGESGLIGIPGLPNVRVPFVGELTFSAADKTGYFIVSLILLTTASVGVYLLMRSRYGLGVHAVRDAQDAAESLGLNATVYRVGVFALSAFIVGAAGGLFAHYLLLLTPSDAVGVPLMVMIVSMVIVGGHRTIVGPVLGAFILTFGAEAFRDIEEYRLMIYGLLVILVMRLMPGGIAQVGTLFHWRRS